MDHARIGDHVRICRIGRVHNGRTGHICRTGHDRICRIGHSVRIGRGRNDLCRSDPIHIDPGHTGDRTDLALAANFCRRIGPDRMDLCSCTGRVRKAL